MGECAHTRSGRWRTHEMTVDFGGGANVRENGERNGKESEDEEEG